MPLPNRAHVKIGGVSFLCDEGYEQLTGRRCYIHGGRSIFAGRTDITGKPGAQNLKEDYLVWALTRFDGEGQVVLDPADPDSAFRFYRSEGLNARTPGQLKLNKSTLAKQVATSNAGTTQQGNADFADITGTSTTSGTDRRLTAVADKVGSGANVSYASDRTVTADFYLFREPFADYATTIQGSAFNTAFGDTADDGTDHVIRANSGAHSAVLETGTHFSAAAVQRVEFFMFYSGTDINATARIQVYRVDTDNVIASQVVTFTDTSAPSAANGVLTFDPKANGDYRIRVTNVGSSDPQGKSSIITLDKVMYGPDPSENTATIEIWNQTGGASVQTKAVAVAATAAGSKVASIAFVATGGVNYRARVERTSGKQAIWVDKVIWNDDSGATGAWVVDCMDVGLGSQSSGVFTPFVWLSARASGVDNVVFKYDSAGDDFDATATLDTATGTNLTTRAMAHSDVHEWVLLSSNEAVRFTAAGSDEVQYDNIPAGVGMTIAQDRLFVLSEGSAGTTVYAAPLDPTTPPNNITTDTAVRSTVINSGAKTPDLSLRQRMCSTPTGARFFINHADLYAKVYEVDSSGSTLVPREIADLGKGVKATCIAYEAGITFIGGQYSGDASSSDPDAKPKAALWIIDQNGVLQRIGFFREDSPDTRPPQFIYPYQTNLFLIQGKYVWRYSLVNGGLFLEYELNPATPGEQRALVATGALTFAAYEDEVFVTGSVGTYRQSSVSGGNTVTSSIYDFGLPAVRKSLVKFDVLTDTLASGTQVRIEYQLDQDGSWLQAGTHSTGDSATFFVEGKAFTTLQVRATLASFSGTATPILKGITVWCSAADDEEYFDLVLLTQDSDSGFRIDGEQGPGSAKSQHIVNLWRSKQVTTFVDAYGSKTGPQDYLVTIEDLRVEHETPGEGRTVVTLKVAK